MAKVLKMFGTVGIVLLLSSSAMAVEGPLQGTYTSFGGDMLEGRGSEAWPTGEDFVLGTVMNLMSWDDADGLGSQWYIECPEACIVDLQIDNVIDGNGFQIWRVVYCDGTLWLSGMDEAWSPGPEAASEYIVDFDEFQAFVTVQWAFGAPVGWVGNVDLTGNFVGYNDCLDLFLAGTGRVGDTTGDILVDFPAFLDAADCAEDATSAGSWWTVSDITMSIIGECDVPTTQTSWGSVKHLYR